MKIIDLTHPISENMPMFPGIEPPKLQVAYKHEEFGFMETYISLFSHTGTHIDAPAHIFKDGITLDKYPISQFVGSALVIDCRKYEKISMQILEKKGNILNNAEFVLFYTGHSKLWGKPEYFANFPIMTQEVVEWVNNRKLKGIGIDAPSFDPITFGEIEQAADDLHNHRTILRTNNTIFIENLCNLEQIGSETFTLCALPLFTSNADGAPARVIALVE